MLTPKFVGALILGLPAILLARMVFWRRNAAVYWFCVALVGVGLGYLMATGATDDIARRLIPARYLSAP